MTSFTSSAVSIIHPNPQGQPRVDWVRPHCETLWRAADILKANRCCESHFPFQRVRFKHTDMSQSLSQCKETKQKTINALVFNPAQSQQFTQKWSWIFRANLPCLSDLMFSVHTAWVISQTQCRKSPGLIYFCLLHKSALLRSLLWELLGSADVWKEERNKPHGDSSRGM